MWVDPYCYADGRPVARLFFRDGTPVIDTPDAGAFTLLDNRILFFPRQPRVSPVPYLLGRVFALWMELAGFPLLHGSSFRTDSGAAGILGDSGMGKSTLSAALVNRGVKLLSDDLIPLIFTDETLVVDPGIPMSRIWPDTGERLVPNYQAAPRIHPKGRKRKVFDDGRGGPRFSDRGEPLRRLFVLDRGDHGLSLESMGPAASLMALVAMSYRPELVQTLGLQQQRMAVMARTLEQVTVYHLRYPSGYEHLDDVCGLMLEADE